MAEHIVMNRLLNITEQIVLFRNCKWTPDCRKIVMRLEKGEITINRQRFDVIFGGFTFMLDDQNERLSRSAWIAFKSLDIVRLRGGWGW